MTKHVSPSSGPTGPGGVVVWVTGRPSSGKSTLGWFVRNELARRGFPCAMLDGDAVRAAIVPAHGYSSEGRAAFYATLAQLAAMLCSQGLVVVVAATANRTAYRSQARSLAPSFLEVYVDTPATECERRDDKGLYARARAAEIDDMPGWSEAFEEPPNPDVVAHGGLDRVALTRIVDCVSRRTT